MPMVTPKVRDVMDTKVVFIDSAATVADAIKKMVQENIWSLVVEKLGTPIGVVITEDILSRCLAKGFNPSTMAVEEIASSPIITIGPDATMEETGKLMLKKDIRRIFVIDGGKIVGRITQRILFESSFDVMETLTGKVFWEKKKKQD
jgi:CBS domain-containing protein